MADRIKAVIFDMGGVLLRTIEPKPREDLAAKFGVTRDELEAFVFNSDSSHQSELGKISIEDHWKKVFLYFGKSFDDYIKVYDQFFAGDAIDKKLLSFAGSLKPEFKLGLLSNAWVSARSLISARFSFIDVFDVSIFSYEVGIRKPDRRIYQTIVDKMGISASEALFIDDMPVNVAGAKAAGLQSLLFEGREEAVAKIKMVLG